MQRPHLRGQTPVSLLALWPDLGMAPGLARRLVSLLVHEDRDDLESLPGLSRETARVLRERGRLTRSSVADRRASGVDPFVKYLFRAEDGVRFEAVRIPLEKPRASVCVSTQAGCALACAFCETGRLGLTRNLEAWEMVGQVLAVRRDSDRPVTGVVFQGQGEPFQNYDEVLRAAAVLRDPCGGRIGADRITISTVGLLPALERYREEGHPYRLILSLTSAFQEKREQVVPLARRHSVEGLVAAMRRLALARGSYASLGWVLISGFNSQPEEAAELARLFRGVRLRVSVIDVNDPSGRFQRATDPERNRFLSALSEHGIGFVRRYSGGPDIHAACGMLASSAQGGRAWAAEGTPA